MYLLGHLGLALLVAAPVAFVLVRAGRTRAACAGVAALLGSVMLPDADLFVSRLAHRGLTHSVWAALVLGGLFAIVAWRLGGGRGPRDRAAFGFGVGATSVVAHLAGDVITPIGIRPFAPLSDVEYSLALVASRDPAANLALFVAGVVVFGHAFALARAGADVPAPTRDASATAADRDETRAVTAPDVADASPASGD
jgi:inner membrane protein